MGAGNLFVFFCLLLVVTPFGRVRLGGADARPDYSRSAWFAILETLPLAHTASFIGLVLVVVFFVTSSDSGSLVIDTITAGGKLDRSPSACSGASSRGSSPSRCTEGRTG